MKSRLKTRENTRGTIMRKIVRHWSDKYSCTSVPIFSSLKTLSLTKCLETSTKQARNHRGSHLNRRFWKTFRSSTFLSLFLSLSLSLSLSHSLTPRVLHNGLSHRSSPRNIISDIILGRWVSSLAAAPRSSPTKPFSRHYNSPRLCSSGSF